ncbi:MAG: hypothetical protein JW874_08960 [Spirochaetales bacterium]|nr:hypothetical protein [Spirochaetales bacterium]
MKKNIILFLCCVFLAMSCTTSNVIKMSKSLFTRNGHTYLVINKTLDWNQANQKCEEAGGYLVIINDGFENKFIQSICNRVAWIGLSDTANEGKFVWVDGSPLDYRYFRDGEPNDYGTGEDWVHKLDSGEWNDSNLSAYDPYDPAFNTYYFICEFDRIIEDEEARQLLVQLYADPADADALVLNTPDPDKVELNTGTTVSMPADPVTEVKDIQPAPVAKSAGKIGIISVLDLKVENMPESEGRLISDLLGSTFISATSVRVIGREQREQIMKEMEFSMSGCVDEACQLEIGRLLAADGIVIGSIGNVGNRYILNIKLLDVQTSEAISTSYKIFKSLDALVDGCEKIVQSLELK